MVSSLKISSIVPVAIASVSSNDGSLVAGKSFGVFRPIQFYEEGGPRRQLETFVRGLKPCGPNAPNGQICVAATLFSWGDVARSTILADGHSQRRDSLSP